MLRLSRVSWLILLMFRPGLLSEHFRNFEDLLGIPSIDLLFWLGAHVTRLFTRLPRGHYPTINSDESSIRSATFCLSVDQLHTRYYSYSVALHMSRIGSDGTPVLRIFGNLCNNGMAASTGLFFSMWSTHLFIFVWNIVISLAVMFLFDWAYLHQLPFLKTWNHHLK